MNPFFSFAKIQFLQSILLASLFLGSSCSKELPSESSKESTQEKIATQEPTQEKKQEPTQEKKQEFVSNELIEKTDDAGTKEISTKETLVQEVPPEQTPDGPNNTVTIDLSDASDAISSYLLSGSAWNLFSGQTVPLGRHTNTAHHSYYTALRFRSVQLPVGAQILSATLSFTPQNSVDKSKRLMLNIYAEKIGDSDAYDPKEYTKGRPDQRLKTAEKIDRWIVRCRDDCSDDINSSKYEYDCKQRKKDCWTQGVSYEVPKDLKKIIQEVVSLADWKPGNAISLFLFNAASDNDGANYQDHRTILGWDTQQKDKAPRLVIRYQK